MKDRIRILVTSDVHGMIFGTDYARGGSRPMGMVKMKTLVDSLRDENTLLIDNGDSLEGTPFIFHYYHVDRTRPNPAAIPLSVMGYDYVNVGNHDFNYGMKELKRFLRETGAFCITGNVVHNGVPLGPKYLLRKIGGLTIAFFGITTQYVPHWENPVNIEGVEFLDAYDYAVKTVSEIKEKEHADVIIGVYHGGFEKNPVTGAITSETDENEGYRIMQDIDGLDLLIMGHQHETAQGVLYGTAYTETKSRAQEIAVHDIDTKTRKITTSIVPVTEETEDDPVLLEKLLPYENACLSWLDKKLGECTEDLRVKDPMDARIHKAQVITLMNEAFMEMSGADLSATALFQGATGFPKEITMRGLLSTYMFPNTLVVKEITGSALKDYLEKNAEFWTVKDGQITVSDRAIPAHPLYHNYDMADGIEYTVKVSNPVGERVISLTRNGVPVKDSDEFTIAVNNYRAVGGGEFDMIKNAPTVKEDARSMVEILAQYIMKHPKIDFTPVHNITLIP